MTEQYIKIIRPKTCCGTCPELVRGGFDCTCKDNERCPLFGKEIANDNTHYHNLGKGMNTRWVACGCGDFND